MNRTGIATNIARELWAQCGGFCQNPNCNKYLFVTVENRKVSLANVAHIIGHGKNGPRSEHELAEYIDKDGLDNLIMLCLECHKVVDELEKQFPVEEMKKWKLHHKKRIDSIFSFPQVRNEKELLEEVNALLFENQIIFEEYGPFSRRALEGASGDTITIWRQRCLDTILPNNQRIVGLIESNKRNFAYPWDVYREMMGYKLHAEAFRDNCLSDKRVNDYKLFPREFSDLVNQKLGFTVETGQCRPEEEVEFRKGTVEKYIQKFLASHSFINRMEKLNEAMFDVGLIDGRNLRVLATNTYFFTEYTFNKVMVIHPAIDAIICSNPYGSYTREAKALCIDQKIGLFMLKGFMGAIRKNGDDFLNYLLKEERTRRLYDLSLCIDKTTISSCFQVYAFGSYLRQELYKDIDLFLVYSIGTNQDLVSATLKSLGEAFERFLSPIDITVCSEAEYKAMSFIDKNPTRIK